MYWIPGKGGPSDSNKAPGLPKRRPLCQPKHQTTVYHWSLLLDTILFTLSHMNLRTMLTLSSHMYPWRLRVQYQAGAMMGLFIPATAFRSALRTTQPSIQWVPGILSSGIKRLERDANHSHPSSFERLRIRGAIYLHSPNTSSWRGV
jgi:hypothetical protein